MRRTWVVLVVALAALATGLVVYFSGREYVYEFSEAQIRDTLSAKLPVSRRYFFVFEVTLDHPRVTLVDGSDRVSAGLDVLLNIHVNGQPMPLGGTVDVSGGVRYDPNQGAFFLAEPRIDALRIQGIPDRYTAKVSAVMADALGDFYRERPVYTLSRADAKQAAARLVLKDVRVSRKTLIVTLGL
ncbi:MAG: DUF1439 domain-containing protein [Xanthomonadales bacterium]|nr:DUF1439 domain-containing protein [Xanthomonadales bacterium]